MTDTIRCFCPLDCGWHHDRPESDPTKLACARPDLTSFEIAHILITGQLQQDEKAIREHLETHELLEWVRAVSRLTAEQKRLATELERRPPVTCGASSTIPGFRNPLGPCVLRHHHDGPVHQDATGATWWLTATPATGAAPADPITTVTNHAHEGVPGAGNLCQAEAFGETCNAPWEQHAMRPES